MPDPDTLGQYIVVPSDSSPGTAWVEADAATVKSFTVRMKDRLVGNPEWAFDPNVLYTRMLLMTDRQGQVGTSDSATTLFRDVGFDHAWGGGRLVIEPIFQWDTASSTWTRRSKAGRVCVRNGRAAEIPLPEVGHGGINNVTVVARFHDAQHAATGQLDEIELQLAEVTSASERDIIAHDRWREEKLRVVGSNLPNGTYEIRLIGAQVSADDENGTCPTGERLVYFAYSWE